MTGVSATACYLGCGDFYPYRAVHKAEEKGPMGVGVNDDYKRHEKPSPPRGWLFIAGNR
jgi:hypothetical protein